MDVHTFYLLSWTEIENDAQAEWPFHRVPYEKDRARELYENYVEQIAYTEEIGFDGVVLNEHHYSAYSMDPSPIVVASHLAALTEELQLIFLGNVIPIRRNPIRVAEELAVLDNLSGGRVVGGVARGIPKEYLAYNIDGGPLDEVDRSKDRLEEAVDLVTKAWTAEEPFDFEGEFFEYENVYIWPKPYQEPRPEIWMPANSERSQRIAAKHRMGVACAGPPDAIREGFEQYTRIAEEEFGWTPSEDKRIWPRRVFVGETEEEAIEAIREHVKFHWEKLFGGVQKGTIARNAGDERFLPEEHGEELSDYVKAQMEYDFDAALERGAFTAGTPEQVVADIEQQYEAIGGAGHLVCTVHHGDAPHEKTMRSLELFGDEVIPELKNLG